MIIVTRKTRRRRLLVVLPHVLVSLAERFVFFGRAAERSPQIPKPLRSPQALKLYNRAPTHPTQNPLHANRCRVRRTELCDSRITSCTLRAKTLARDAIHSRSFDMS